MRKKLTEGEVQRGKFPERDVRARERIGTELRKRGNRPYRFNKKAPPSKTHSENLTSHSERSQSSEGKIGKKLREFPWRGPALLSAGG